MIRVLIADDHPLIREGLRSILAECQDIELVAETDNGNNLLALCADNKIDIVVLDISMPGPGLLKTMASLQQHVPETRILILSTYQEEHYAVRALRAGAQGYLTKDRSMEELANALRRIHSGKPFITESVAEKLAAVLHGSAAGAPHESLTDREYEVFQLLGQGKSVTEIGNILSLSPKTISTYRARIMDKMGLHSTVEIIRYVVTHNIV